MRDTLFNRTMFFVVCAAGICFLQVEAKDLRSGKGDDAFLRMAAQADMTAAHIGKMAADRGSTTSVKDLGKTLAQDHAEDYRQLTELCSKTGDAIPKAINGQNDQKIKTLEKYSGKTFDQRFLEWQTTEHARLIKAFKEEAEHGKNSDIKAYANKALPVMERHLHEAQGLMKHGTHKG